jgi:hypothetical protein
MVGRMTEVERQLLPLVVIIALGVVVWLFTEWIHRATLTPEPWGSELDQAIENEEVPPVCPHCSATYSEADYFCPACGESVGCYNNYSPYLYIFSMGDVLRRGTSEKIQVNAFTVTGYLVLSLCQYFWLAPIYWVMFFINLARQGKPPPLAP